MSTLDELARRSVTELLLAALNHEFGTPLGEPLAHLYDLVDEIPSTSHLAPLARRDANLAIQTVEELDRFTAKYYNERKSAVLSGELKIEEFVEDFGSTAGQYIRRFDKLVQRMEMIWNKGLGTDLYERRIRPLRRLASNFPRILLALSELAHLSKPIVREHCRIDKIVADAQSAIKIDPKEADLQVDWSIALQQDSFMVERGLMLLILRNLFANSIKYRATNSVRIRVRSHTVDPTKVNESRKVARDFGYISTGVRDAPIAPGWLNISVEDNGKGIEPNFRAKAFRLYAREPKAVADEREVQSRTSPYGLSNIGLGLAFVAAAVTAHRGFAYAGSSTCGGTRIELFISP